MTSLEEQVQMRKTLLALARRCRNKGQSFDQFLEFANKRITNIEEVLGNTWEEPMFNLVWKGDW